MNKLQIVKSDGQLGKREQITKYLKQNDGYWLENDEWDLTKGFFVDRKVFTNTTVSFSMFVNKPIKNEIKYYFLYNYRNSLISIKTLVRQGNSFKRLGEFLNKYYPTINSLAELDAERIHYRWKTFLTENNLSLANTHLSDITNYIFNLIIYFYDDREETEKDIWYAKNIVGVKIPASGSAQANNELNFMAIPAYYRDIVKSYFKTIVTKKSFNHCVQIITTLNYFFNCFYSRGYTDGFLEQLTRNDVEDYLFQLGNDFKSKNPTYRCKFVSYVRTFLEYIQLAQYNKAPKKEVAFLIFQSDIPKRELNKDEVKKVKFIPEPIVKQLDNNIMDLDRTEYIPIYILLRETGWRGTDILNLRYNNCLENVWNKKEDNYNYYLCGEITKTGIAEHKIPIRSKVVEMTKRCVDKAKEKSSEENNPNKYLFNTYEGKFKGKPARKLNIVNSIRRLIKQKNILDADGNLYHFKMHSLRHTRAKEYVEQGMGISIIQQILGHTSLQMTVHYATVAENTLYEKWKATEDLDLFRVNQITQGTEQIDINTEDSETLIRYEYIKKNLDAVRVPFGVCFKPSKVPCKQQMNHCLTCASFCTTIENIPEYEEEIIRVKEQIEISERCGRQLWAEKNKTYLRLLEELLQKVKQQKIVHKNGRSREEQLPINYTKRN